MKGSGNASTDFSAYNLEFRCSEDDAWYSVRVVIDGDTLTVKFWNFPEACDERYNVGDFQTLQAVNDFVQKFRPISAQLQDSQCSKVIEGMTVCASFTDSLAFNDDDLRFYDAVVEAVHYEKHSFSKEEEECLCAFVLLWQHGPKEGTLTSTNIANICLIQSAAQVDPRVASFSKMAKEKIEISSFKSGLISKGDISSSKGSTCDIENYGSSIKLQSSLSRYGLQEKESIRQFGSPLRTTEGRFNKCHERIDQDQDFGGKSLDIKGMEEISSHHLLLIENLEKDLSASSMMEFIHKQTSISPQAYIFPSLSSESYTRGAIVLDCKKKLKKIYEFLNNPDRIIMSSRGRPWVITEKLLRCGTFKTPLGSLMPESQYKFQNRNIDGELKVVYLGTEEYRTAKRLRDLFMDFVDHQQRLHKRLAMEEKKILQSSRQFSCCKC
uniref:SAWADEE domain-containing protein n=1 Tax=Davidia involucrata TaxID=16924 RepID=A0A5B7AJB6_DAVIN